MTYAELWDSLTNMNQLMKTQAHVVNNHFVGQAKQGDMPPQNASNPASRIRDFMRMNSPTIHGTKVDEYPQGLIDEVFNVVDVMGVKPREKAELSTYQLKDVAQVVYEQ